MAAGSSILPPHTAPGTPGVTAGLKPGTADYFRVYAADAAQEAAKIVGLPANLAGAFGSVYVQQIQQESGFRPGARSSAGAAGIAQIMPGDHPGAPPASDPYGQLDWAALYMAQLVKKYGNYEDALSVYNSGRPWAQGQHIGQTRAYVSTILGNVAKAVKSLATTYGAGGTPAGQSAFGGVALAPSTVGAGALGTASSIAQAAGAGLGGLDQLATAATDIVAFLLNPVTWRRAGLIIGGAVLMFGGLFLLARSQGLSVPMAP